MTLQPVCCVHRVMMNAYTVICTRFEPDQPVLDKTLLLQAPNCTTKRHMSEQAEAIHVSQPISDKRIHTEQVFVFKMYLYSKWDGPK